MKGLHFMLVNHESRRGQSMANYRVPVPNDSKFYVRLILGGNLKSHTQSIIMHVHKTINKTQVFLKVSPKSGFGVRRLLKFPTAS